MAMVLQLVGVGLLAVVFLTGIFFKRGDDATTLLGIDGCHIGDKGCRPPIDLGPTRETALSASQLATFLSWLLLVAWFALAKAVPSRNTTRTKASGPADDSNKGKESLGEGSDIEQAVHHTVERTHWLSLSPEATKALHAAVLFGAILMYFFLCDVYEALGPGGKKSYNRDIYAFILIVILLHAFSTFEALKDDTLMNRHQTEEWKGWMQIIFVLYHYFAAGETYNSIRIYIAAYVFLTGFGNFSFFWIKKDYSLYRVSKMLFRLNFMVVFVCLVTGNSYMLYYICPMHTFFFLSCYLFMRIGSSWNTIPYKMAIKFAVYFLLSFLIWDIKGVGEIVFVPLYSIVRYQQQMHEWLFRTGLDHFATPVGMLVAYFHPNLSALLARAENHPRGTLFKSLVAVPVALTFALWAYYVHSLPKWDYNALHPYLSWIPLLSYIFFRNISKSARGYASAFLVWCGKITLETYLAQLHIWLQSNAKALLIYIPNYPLVNFTIASVIYFGLSYYCFLFTNTISAWFLPSRDRLGESARKGAKLVGVWLLLLVVSYAILAV